MSVGPTIVYDKSAMQRLSAEEASWFTHFFRPVITPIYLIEVLGDLAKEKSKRDPREMVAALASKTQSGIGSVPNVDHGALIDGEILGNPVEMRGRPIMGGGIQFRGPDGKLGVVFDETPEDVALRRWRAGEFRDAEHGHSASYRASLKAIDLQAFVRARKAFHPKGQPVASSLAELLSDISSFLDNPRSQFRTLSAALEMFDQPEMSRRHVKKMWVAYGRPMIRDFLPYTHFCMKVSMLFGFGVMLQLIGERNTNAIDVQYLFYLPFCQVFTSADQLHADLVPLFLQERQVFVDTEELRTALRDLIAYYRQHEAELKKGGMMGFARYPPLDLKTGLHDIYDKLMPSWRDAAAHPEPKMSPEESKRLFEKMRPMTEAMEKALEAHRESGGNRTNTDD